jgi:hypothetical protein
MEGKMKHNNIVLGTSGFLVLFLIVGSCNENSISVIRHSQNLIQNPSFESNGQPTLQSWIADTAYVKFVRDVPSGGGQWSVHVEAPWVPPGEGVTTYITGQSGTGVYKLSAFVKTMIVGGHLMLGIWKDGSPGDFKSAIAEQADSTGWAEVTLLDTLSLEATDSIWVHFTVGCCMTRIPANQARLDLVKLERIQ